jgi:hypothetical protein
MIDSARASVGNRSTYSLFFPTPQKKPDALQKKTPKRSPSCGPSGLLYGVKVKSGIASGMEMSQLKDWVW